MFEQVSSDCHEISLAVVLMSHVCSVFGEGAGFGTCSEVQCIMANGYMGSP